ncbi:hypothetical protein IT570_02605, partial [Candidatus Sumerlaeota bacterium]|nr:hypothetical protein [Candidatus Sumerlaeota bacterium]
MITEKKRKDCGSYSYSGRRILEYKNTDGIRTRSFFNGLTEEIKKVSVGTGADTSFARELKLSSAAGEEAAYANYSSSHPTTIGYDGERL